MGKERSALDSVFGIYRHHCEDQEPRSEERFPLRNISNNFYIKKRGAKELLNDFSSLAVHANHGGLRFPER